MCVSWERSCQAELGFAPAFSLVMIMSPSPQWTEHSLSSSVTVAVIVSLYLDVLGIFWSSQIIICMYVFMVYMELTVRVVCHSLVCCWCQQLVLSIVAQRANAEADSGQVGLFHDWAHFSPLCLKMHQHSSLPGPFLWSSHSFADMVRAT